MTEEIIGEVHETGIKLLLAMLFALNPLIPFNWILYLIIVAILYFGNPFGVINDPESEDPDDKSWLRAFVLAIPLYAVINLTIAKLVMDFLFFVIPLILKLLSRAPVPIPV